MKYIGDIDFPEGQEELECLPCPFCAWEKIRFIEEKIIHGFFEGSLRNFCWCKVCGCCGPSAIRIEGADWENYNDCVNRWNERNGIKENN